ncbi:glyoxylate reductase/hydroxypyruvate reductase-like [Ruditapes philippinarum]|uniref:glyoxylate reductase/hydroxypyruvate reductase-like n=1 Tax=Ruditapes philippinarum TaxID=129788 RepID=UPI00295ABA23|nr:glyoxylate reductase/hydroxypyruvate reductase-like [Ruditapes philippinarum]
MLSVISTTKSCRPKVYITRQIPQKGLDLLLGRCNVSYWDSHDPATKTELLVNIPGCDVLICMPTDKIDRDILNAAGPSLKIVATMSEDSDHIETSECSRRNIRVLTLPKITFDTVAQMAIALLRVITADWTSGSNSNLNLIIQSKDVIQNIKNDATYCLELSNRTVGIIGMGPLGLSVGKMLKSLGVSALIYNDIKSVAMATDIDASFVEKDILLETSDIIFVCSNLGLSSGKNGCLFNKAAFHKMKSSAILIDVTKGLLANFTDMYNALRDGELEAVGLDVREYDVIPNRHPLASLENCYFLPFRECYKWDGRRKCSAELATSILSALQEIEISKKKQEPVICSPGESLVPKMSIPVHI